MRVATTVAEARAACRALRSSSRELSLGLVPTMGALHAGHLSLVAAARRDCEVVLTSIFVNPTQFAPGEDLDRYPRTLAADCHLLEEAGVDLVFAPAAKEMYPSGGLDTFVDPGILGDRLDGRSRPGHFRGVCTVVSKLFHGLDPDVAYFGQKDAAQVAVLRAMVRDLDFRTRLQVCPTVRDADGLALSSRNRYLNPEQRQTALLLYRALQAAGDQVRSGERDTAVLLRCLRWHLEHPGLRVDYVEAIDKTTLLPVPIASEDTLLAVAAWIGDTRLIDNLPIADVITALRI